MFWKNKGFLLLLSLRLICQVETLFRKYRFGSDQWPQMMYKRIQRSATSLIECASVCQAEGPTCQAFSMDNSGCLLGDPAKHFDLIVSPQVTDRDVYTTPGFKINLFKTCQFLRAFHFFFV